MNLCIVIDKELSGPNEDIIYYLKLKHKVQVIESDFTDLEHVISNYNGLKLWLSSKNSLPPSNIWHQIKANVHDWLILTDSSEIPRKELILQGANFIVLPPLSSAYLNTNNYNLLNIAIDILAWCIEKMRIKERSLELLSKKENEVVNLLLQGLDDKEISKKLFISDKTVRNHISNILQKVGLKNRTQLVLWALQQIGKIEQLS